MPTSLKQRNNFFSTSSLINRNPTNCITTLKNKLENPFLKQWLIPNHSVHSQPLLLRPNSKSCFSFKTRKSSRKQQYFGCEKFHKSHSLLKDDRNYFKRSQNLYQQFVKQRDKDIQRKRLDVFGIEALRYIPNIQNKQQKNIDYFDKNNMYSIQANKINKFFTESTNIYTLNEQNNSQNKKLYRKKSKIKSQYKVKQNQPELQRNRSKFKVKKMLSWDQQKLKSDKQNIQANSQKNINQDQNQHPTFGTINKNSQSDQKINKFNNKSKDSPFFRSKSKDYILQKNEKFNMQSNNPYSSSYSISQDFVDYNQLYQNNHNLRYSSNYFESHLPKFSSSSKSSDFFRSGSKQFSKMSFISQDQHLYRKTNQCKKQYKNIINMPSSINYHGINYQFVECFR